MAADGVSEGFQQRSRLAHPVCQRGAVKIETFAIVDLALAVKGQMVGVFADQHMGQETRARAAALDRARWQWRVHEPFTASARQPGPHDAVHDEAPGDIFQLLGHIFTDAAQTPTALGTGIGARAQFHVHPRDMVRDRAALRFVLLFDVRQLHPRGHRGGGDLTRLEGQLQLVRSLGRGPEPVRPMACQLMAQLLDQDRLRLHLGQEPRGETAQLLGIVRQGQGVVEHARSLSCRNPCGNPAIACPSDYPADRGRQVRSGARQSIPSSSIDS